MKLMYSSKTDRPVTRAELAHIPVPPALGRFHKPYSYSEYVNVVEEKLDKNGLELLAPEFAVSRDHQRFFGVAEVAPMEGDLITAKDWKLLIGLRGAYDQKFPRGLTLGRSVLVCSNLCFSGGIGTFTTKQTTNIGARIGDLVEEAVKRIPDLARREENFVTAMKENTLNPQKGDVILMDMYRKNGLTAAQLGRAATDWGSLEDRHGYHQHEEHTFWKLHNDVTQALKPTGEGFNVATHAERSEVCDLVVRQNLREKFRQAA